MSTPPSARVRAALHALQRYPEGHATLLHALDDLLTPPQLVVVRAADSDLPQWQRVLHAGYHPHRLTFAMPADAEPLPGLLAERTPRARRRRLRLRRHHLPRAASTTIADARRRAREVAAPRPAAQRLPDAPRRYSAGGRKAGA